ncbi:UvrD-helicase domain-containing protein [Butyricimonas hominis]|jgi:ATP-dependent helicase|uniref:DNA 3'-5' helicase n=1 Tax=Butyricimonas hominis TaxID=2763032 RepID=A0ABR7CYN8_9BACT|nr:UvrD-helicase domain-containing protein [Butyricimonas hominis]MBC5620781.1 UvrD-helicase domain-containing protein [Butyricimonas hominis]
MLQVYRASAGAGKTFALTMEYFKIVFNSPLEYKNVLAVTFTNKATEEMKSRIVRELNKLAEGQKSDYREDLKRSLRLSDEQVKARAEVLRTLILHDYGRLAVTTIDRFFQRVIKAFTRELGIFPGYNVELDSDYVLQRAVDQVMQRMNKDRELGAWITELMNDSVEDARSWSVKSKIAELGKELFGESYMLFDKDVQERFSDRDFLKIYKRFLQGIITGFEKRLQEYGRIGCVFMEEQGLHVEDFKGGKRSAVTHFYKLKDKNLDGITATIRKAVDNLDEWVTKSMDAAGRARVEDAYTTLNTWLRESVEFYDEHLRDYVSARLLSGNLYQLGILNDLYGEVRDYCDEKGLMLLSDTTRLLNTLIAGNDTSFLFEKTGNFYKHVMIDEFQDTSTMQWANFRPLIVNTLAEGGRAMLVGDVKQSIYRWRNGDWRLLAEGVERDFTAFGTDNIVLGHNWRSSREIVEFNNRFFVQAAGQLKELYDAECGEDNVYSRSIAEAYNKPEQLVSRPGNGYVEIRFGEEKQEEGSDTAIMEEVVAIVNDTVRRGGHLKDCVILVRNGKEGAFAADYLIEYNKREGIPFPVTFISNDSLYVSSSPYVELIINVLRYMVEPYDAVNRTVLLYNYRTFVKGENTAEDDELFKAGGQAESFLDTLDIPFLREPERLVSGSLFEITEEIIEAFGLKNRTEELPYLIAFQDILFEYERNNTNSLPVFLEWWEKEKDKKVLSTSEETDAVRILTIHKSKGLEFKSVIIPFCAWDLDDTRHGRRIWCRNREEGFRDLEYAPLNYSPKLADSHFREDYMEEHMKAYVDNLNLLYVALTRAERELYVLPYAPKISKEGKPSDIGAFLYQVLEQLALPEWDGENLCLRIGRQEVIPVSGKVNDDNTLSLSEYPIYNLNGRVSVRYKYEDYTDPENIETSAVDEGKMLHEIFRRIETVNDIDRAVGDMYRAGLINNDERAVYREQVVGFLKNNVPSEWFDGKYKIINERDILFKGTGKARPDRVMTDGRKAVVVDYKFGRKEEKSYLRQVGFYCKTLRQMGYTDVSGYIWYVTLDKIVPVYTESTPVQLQLFD